MYNQMWPEKANCKNIDTDLFFISAGEAISPEVKAACDSCEVQQECLNWAVRHESTGYWGGTTARERESLRSKLKIPFKACYRESSFSYKY